MTYIDLKIEGKATDVLKNKLRDTHENIKKTYDL